MQLMTAQFNGKVEAASKREYGQAFIDVKENKGGLFSELPTNQQVWMSHGDLVTEVPEGFEVTATSTDCPIAAMVDTDASILWRSIPPGSSSL